MLPKTDLFNQLYYRSDDGFVAIICYDGDIPDIEQTIAVIESITADVSNIIIN